MNTPRLIHQAEMISDSQEETENLGCLLGASLGERGLLALSGDLGAGKTYLVKGLALGLRCLRPEEVVSPSFTLLNVYPGRVNLYHFDLYRLNDYNDFIAIGGEEYLEQPGVVAIEWAEKIISHLPAEYLSVQIRWLEENKRRISIQAQGEYHQKIFFTLTLSGLGGKFRRLSDKEDPFEGFVH